MFCRREFALSSSVIVLFVSVVVFLEKKKKQEALFSDQLIYNEFHRVALRYNHTSPIKLVGNAGP